MEGQRVQRLAPLRFQEDSLEGTKKAPVTASKGSDIQEASDATSAWPAVVEIPQQKQTSMHCVPCLDWCPQGDEKQAFPI